MCLRTSGSSANRTISWISFLPPSSAGWALPAITSWTGRSGWVSSRLRRSGALSISVSRLYDGTRRGEAVVGGAGGGAAAPPGSSGGGGARLRVGRGGVERVVPPGQLGGGDAALGVGGEEALAGVDDEPLAQHPLDRPDVTAGDVVDRGPERVGVVGLADGAVPLGEVEDLAADPG